MAVAKLSKLFIVTHNSETESLLKKIQRCARVEIRPYSGKIGQEMPVVDVSTENNLKVKKALDIFNDFKERELKKMAARTGKMVVKRSRYEKILENRELEEVADNVIDMEAEISNIDTRIADAAPRINQLEVWACYKYNLEDIASRDAYTIKLGLIKSGRTDFRQIASDLDSNNISCQVLSEEGDIIYVILAYHNDYKKEAEEFLGSIAFEAAELTAYKGTIEENLNTLKRNIQFYQERRENLVRQIREASRRHEEELTIYLDYLDNNLEVEEAVKSGFSTESVSFYTAWIKEKDKENIFGLIGRFRSSRVMEIEPEPGENIPIILENKPLFRPFEIIINLYGVPRYFEIDPTPMVSLFFAMFFGLCLTDAGYGIILAVLTLIFAFRMKNARQFLMLIFAGAIFTIFAGALFNGWFGDLPSYLGLDNFFSKLAILGDPVRSDYGAMNFFRLALALGVVHVMFGLLIKFGDALRRKDWAGAFFDGLPWIAIIGSLIVLLLSTQMAVSMQLVSEPIFPSGISRILIWPILVGAIVIIFFGARDEKSWGFRLFMGFLNLTIVNGITSFLGDFLSYIRLMALGLVTAGIGVAMNRIAFQFLSIPVAGVVIVVIILIFGHVFNIGINILGGFVHTLRLQYVEFFPKFYIGGGRPFKALKEEHKYITIVD